MNRPAAAEQAWTLGRLLEWTTRHFQEKGVEFPLLDAQVLLAHAVGCKRIDLYTRFEEPATDTNRARFKELIRRRVEGCPVAYLVGRKEFFSLELEVSPAVLIPRPDTETLVTAALEYARNLAEPAILDLGTGSGCIAVALAKQMKTARVTAVDVSPEALQVARGNAARHGVADRIQFLQGDLFEPLAAAQLFNLIVSNPPYIPTAEIPKLEIGVRHYEPALALDGGPTGYEVIGRIIREAGRHLESGGQLMIEIGTAQEQKVRALLETQSGFSVAPTLRDYSRHPRVLRASWHGSDATASSMNN